ncbi:hypothetical protein SAMN05720781_2767 [Fibrobacter sp. UWT3]|nr:hypothetical protein SAMN05720781_2767 [Fibrobacter sp. UWT3]
MRLGRAPNGLALPKTLPTLNNPLYSNYKIVV